MVRRREAKEGGTSGKSGGAEGKAKAARGEGAAGGSLSGGEPKGFQTPAAPAPSSSQAQQSGSSRKEGQSAAALDPAAARGLNKASGPSLRSPRRPNQRAIPEAVANRMARRSVIASGFPTLMGMGVFVISYLLVSRAILDIPPAATLVASGGCFLLGLVGLSYGVFSSSWEEQPGSLLGGEQIRVNLGRLRESIRAMRQGSP